MSTAPYSIAVANRSAPSAPRILVVDDTPLMRDLSTRILHGEGFQTAVAGSGEEAFEILRSVRIDLVLMDVQMPVVNGFEVCRRIKSDRELSDIPIIFVSALDESTDRLRGFEAGGVDYIPKPFFGEELLARIRTHLRLEKARDCAVREMEAKLAELREAQRSILVTPEELPEASFAVCYRPLADVGGDLYDVLPLGDGLFGYFVGDISGHGIEASFLTGAVKALLRQFSGPLFTAAQTLGGLNRVLRATLREGQYLTAVYARFSRERQLLTVAVAGHPAPILLPRGGDAGTFCASSDPLGLFETTMLEVRDIPVQPGDRLFLFTDGAIEDPDLPGGGRSVGIERLCRACEESRDVSLARSVTAIGDLARRPGRPASDDLLILAMEVPE